MKIFLDMDGVLAQLVPAVLAYHKLDPHWPKGEYSMEVVTGVNVFENLPPLIYQHLEPEPECFELLSMFPDAIICTNASCYSEYHKWKWLEAHDIQNEVIFIKDKYLLARPDRLLIDDYEQNCIGWAEAGGLAFIWGQRWNSAPERNKLELLKGFLNGNDQ